MNILDKIAAHKLKEIEERKSLFPTKLLEQSIYFEHQPVSMKKYILREDKVGIIAEIKRQSPSKGTINQYVSIERTSIGYMQAGASGLSVLTDTEFFGGKNEDLTIARRYNFCPILRKDFILDEYQIIEAKSIGSDTILLIAAILEPDKLKKMAAFAQSLQLEVLMEIHNEQELEGNINPFIDLIGINNRDLKNFKTSLETSFKLGDKIPDEFVKISESGINQTSDILELKEHGFQGFLIGGNFMLSSRPEKACEQFIQQLKISTEKPVKI